MARVKVRTPRRAPEANVAGQLAIDTDEAWQSSTCECWPPDLRGCGHCRICDTCDD